MIAKDFKFAKDFEVIRLLMTSKVYTRREKFILPMNKKKHSPWGVVTLFWEILESVLGKCLWEFPFLTELQVVGPLWEKLRKTSIKKHQFLFSIFVNFNTVTKAPLKYMFFSTTDTFLGQWILEKYEITCFRSGFDLSLQTTFSVHKIVEETLKKRYKYCNIC